MSNFVRVTETGKKAIWINTDSIKFIEKTLAGGSYIVFSRRHYLVVIDSPEEITK